MIKAEHKKNTMLLFDLDGTLWDSSQQVAESWNEVIKVELPQMELLTKEDIMSVMGKTMQEIAATVLKDVKGDNVGEVFKKCEVYEVEYIEKSGGVLFDKVYETLKALRDAGYDMAVVSNCQTGYINAFYVSMKTGDFFCDMEEWGNTGKTKDENIKLVMERNGYDRAVYIGDTEKDEVAAHGAGIPFVHASYGFGEVTSAEHVISSFDELLDLKFD